MSASKKNIYCISGLGADEKAFEKLHVNGCSFKCLQWISPLTKESLSSYAKRMSDQIEESNPIIVGLSFGGMIAMEMAKQIVTQKIILVSTAKTYKEMPAWMRLAGTLNLHKLIPIKLTRLTEKANDRRMGIETIDEKQFVDYYRKNADEKYVDWAVDQILNWKNTWIPENAFHIHGEKDRMFPLRNIQPTHIIKEGTHIMVLNRAEEVSSCIEKIVFGTS